MKLSLRDNEPSERIDDNLSDDSLTISTQQPTTKNGYKIISITGKK